MTRFLHLITVIGGSLALVGGCMMAATGLLLFVGSNLFPNVAEIPVQVLVASVAGGGLSVVIGWMLLTILTRTQPTRSTGGDD